MARYIGHASFCFYLHVGLGRCLQPIGRSKSSMLSSLSDHLSSRSLHLSIISCDSLAAGDETAQISQIDDSANTTISTVLWRRSLQKAHRSAPAAAPLYARQSNNSAKEKCMLRANLSTRRKRACSEQHTGYQNETLTLVKRRRASHPSESTPAFWDNLSNICLTKRALRELDRRNTQAISSASRAPQQESSIVSDRERANDLRSDDARALETFSRHGGPDLSDLRNFPGPIYITKHTMSASRSSNRSRQRDSASASTGVYDRSFQQHLVDYNVYPDAYEYPDGSIPAEPDNWDELQNILAQPRPSLAPSRFSDERFREFRKADAYAPKEKQVSERAIAIIEGTFPDDKCRSGGIPFNNLDTLTDGTLKPANPDIYYGARPEQLNRQIRTELSRHIIPSTQDDLPIVPNFFLAVKGPDGSLAVAERQACYDGALGARGIASLQTYRQDGPSYGTAQTISSTYHGGTLKMYTSHVAQPSSPRGSPKYYMTQLNTWGMTGNADTFRRGARAYRNARDWAKKQREEVIRQANEKAAPMDTEVYTTGQLSRTSMNEGLDMEIYEDSDSSVEGRSDDRLAAQQSNKRKRCSTNTESSKRLRGN